MIKGQDPSRDSKEFQMVTMEEEALAPHYSHSIVTLMAIHYVES